MACPHCGCPDPQQTYQMLPEDPKEALKRERRHLLAILAGPIFPFHYKEGRSIARIATMAVNDAEALLAEIERRES
jgi:hypothetical protein